MGDRGHRLTDAIRRGVGAAFANFRPLNDATVKSQVERLLSISDEHRRLLLANLDGLPRYEVVQELLSEYQRRLHGDPQAILTAAEIALETAEAASSLPRALQCDLRAECWMALANALRISEKFDLAEAAWRAAESCYVLGTGDPKLRAEMLALQGSLRSEQQRFVEAAQLLRRAIGGFRRLEETALASRMMIRLAMTLRQAGDLGGAITATWRGLQSLESPRQQPALVRIALHNLVNMYQAAGMPQIALVLMSRLEESNFGADAPTNRLRARWVTALFCSAGGFHDAGARILDLVRTGFLAQDTPYDAALVALDQAAAYAQLGEHAKVRELAREMIPVFRSKQIVREARVALALFVRASRAEALTAEAITHFSRRVELASMGTSRS